MGFRYKNQYKDSLFFNNNKVHTLYFEDRWIAGIHKTCVFFGGSTKNDASGKVNDVNVFNVVGTYLNSDNSYSTYGRYGVAGAAVGDVGMFYGGGDWTIKTPYLTRLNTAGIPISLDMNVGSGANSAAGGSTSSVAIYRGGGDLFNAGGTNIIRRINSSGILLGTETPVGSSTYGSASASFNDSVLFYGGHIVNNAKQNIALNMNASGTLIGMEVAVGSEATRYLSGGRVSSSIGLFYGGSVYSGTAQANIVRRIDKDSLTIVSADVRVGSPTMGMGASTMYDFTNNGVMFYGGATESTLDNKVVLNNLIRISDVGTQLGSVQSIGKSRWGLAGASV